MSSQPQQQRPEQEPGGGGVGETKRRKARRKKGRGGFAAWARLQRQKSREEPRADKVEVFDKGRPTSATLHRGRNHPPAARADQYFTVECADGSSVVLPERALWLSKTLRAAATNDAFADSATRTIRLPELKPRIVESVLEYCFKYYLESWAVFAPIDKKSRSKDLLLLSERDDPVVEDESGSLEDDLKEDDDELLSLDDDYDEIYHRIVEQQQQQQQSHKNKDKNNNNNTDQMVTLHFEIQPIDAFDVLYTAHYLGVEPLIALSSKMVAHYIDRVPIEALCSLHRDLLEAVLAHVQPMPFCTVMHKLHLAKENVVLDADLKPVWRRMFERVDGGVGMMKQCPADIPMYSFYVQCHFEHITKRLSQRSIDDYRRILREFGSLVRGTLTVPTQAELVGMSAKELLSYTPNVTTLIVSRHRLGQFTLPACNAYLVPDSTSLTPATPNTHRDETLELPPQMMEEVTFVAESMPAMSEVAHELRTMRPVDVEFEAHPRNRVLVRKMCNPPSPSRKLRRRLSRRSDDTDDDNQDGGGGGGGGDDDQQASGITMLGAIDDKKTTSSNNTSSRTTPSGGGSGNHKSADSPLNSIEAQTQTMLRMCNENRVFNTGARHMLMDVMEFVCRPESRVTRLVMEQCELTNKDVRAMSAMLLSQADTPSLKKWELSDNFITMVGLVQLLRTCARLGIEELDVSRNRIFGKAFVGTLTTDDDEEDEEAKHENGNSSKWRLNRLNLAYNNLGSRAKASSWKMDIHGQQWTRYSFGNRARGAFEIGRPTPAEIQQHRTLTPSDVEWVWRNDSMLDEGINTDLFAHLPATMRDLDVSGNSLGFHSQLIQALQTNLSNIRELKFSRNNVQDTGWQQLLACIRSNRLQHVEHIDLSHNMISFWNSQDDLETVLSRTLADGRTLQSVNISHNRMVQRSAADYLAMFARLRATWAERASSEGDGGGEDEKPPVIHVNRRQLGHAMHGPLDNLASNPCVALTDHE